MKSIFLSVSAIALTACAATGADEHRAEHRDHRVNIVRSGDHHFGGQHRVIEIIAGDGNRTVVTGDGSSVVIVDGQRIEVVDGAVIVDGERHEFENGRVVIENGDVSISEGGRHHVWAWSGSHDEAATEAAIEAAMAEVERAMAEVDSIDWVAHNEALAEAMAEVETMRVEIDDPDEDTWITRDGERVRFGDLSPEEQEEIREDLAEARVSVRMALREAREDMRDAQRDQRVARIEMRRARDEARRAGHEAREARRHMRWHFDDMGDANEIRIESENGDTRVWLDDRELEGAELEEFLDRMEERNERFAEMHSGDDPNVMVFRSEDGEVDVIRRGRIVIERDGERRRVIEIDRADDELDGGDD